MNLLILTVIHSPVANFNLTVIPAPHSLTVITREYPKTWDNLINRLSS